MRRSNALVLLSVAGLAAFAVPAGAGKLPQAGTPSSPITFQDSTLAAGLTSADPASDPLKGNYLHDSSWGDVDGDGDLDLYVGTFTDDTPSFYLQRGAEGPLPNTLLINDGSGRFTVDTASPDLRIAGATSGSVFADLDGDGDRDLVVTSYRWPDGTTTAVRRMQPNRLFRNDGGRFVDVSAGSGIHPEGFTTARSVSVLDYDGDRCPDLYLVADPFHGATSSSRLVRGDCQLHFSDVTASAGLATAQGDIVQGLGAAVGDLDGDSWPDLVVAGGPIDRPRRNFVFVNDRTGAFREVSQGSLDEPPLRADPAEDWTSGAAIGDLDRDGRADLVISHHYGSSSTDPGGGGANAEPKAPAVWMNRTTTGGAVTLERVTGSSAPVALLSKAPHAEVQDMDNDGRMDIVVSVVGSVAGGPRVPLVYRNTEATRGATPSFTLPPYDQSSLHYFAGGPVADYDRDGRLDVFLNEWRPTYAPPLFRNTTSGGRWLDVRVLDGTNRDGIGARVSVYRAGKLGIESARLATGWVQLGNGFSSAGPPEVHLGLGGVRSVDVRVDLPGGGGNIGVRQVAVDRTLTLGS